MDSGGPRSWTRRAFEATGWSPGATGAVVAVVVAAVFTLQELALGRFEGAELDPGFLGDVRVTLTHIAIAAYVLSASVYFEQVRDATIHDLHESFGVPQGRTGLYPLTTGVAVVIGLVAAVVLSSTLSPGPTSYDPATWTPITAWHRVLALVIGAATSRLFFLILIESGRVSDRATAFGEVDLLAPERLAPFVRLGLTGALLAIGGFSVYALFLMDVGYLHLVAGLLVLSIVVGGTALFLPLRGVRLRVKQSKEQELAWCRGRIREARDRLRYGDASGDLEELLAWEARIKGISEWPVDSSTFRRFGLYLLIPLGSWAGGAIVERLIDALLD